MIDDLPNHIKSKITVCETRSCWLWGGEIDHTGYGRAWFKGFRYQAHRLIYWLTGQTGFKIDDRKKELDHLCEIKHCVNPDHLEVVNRRTNVKRIFKRRKKINENG